MNPFSRLSPITLFISCLALLALACNAPLREGITVTLESPTLETKIEITSEPVSTTEITRELAGTRILFETETPSATETSTATPTVTATNTPDPTVEAAKLTVTAAVEETATITSRETATASAATSTLAPTNTPWPSPTVVWVPTTTPWPSPTRTPVWQPTNTPRPAATATLVPQIQQQPLGFDYTVWWRKSETEGGIAIATFTINPRGGDGNYQYFHDDLPVEGPVFEVRWGTCRAKPGSLRVDSAGESVRVDYFERSAC